MLKKLQNLLFEEEDDDIEDEEEEVTPVAPVKPRPVQAAEPVAPRPIEMPAAPVLPVEEVKPAMQRIDVTQAVPSLEPKEAPVSNLDSLFNEPVPEVKPVAVKKPLGIKLDDVPAPAPAPVAAPAAAKQPVVKQEIRKAPKKETVKPATATYQFKPVISPIFGVDEKDLTAVKNTASRVTAKEFGQTGNITPIISPMYGANEDDKPSLIGDTVERSSVLERATGNASSYKAEDDIPEFSLDDILKVRDEEFAGEKTAENDFPAFFADEAEEVEEAVENTAEEVKDHALVFPAFDFDDEETPDGETLVLNRKDIDGKAE